MNHPNLKTQHLEVTAGLNDAKIDRIFAEFDRCAMPGVAVGISIKGIPVYRKGFGLASMELPVTLSPTTRMRIGSVSKQFTALAYLLLCEDGRASIADPVKMHFPEFKEFPNSVTMRQLLGHTSGIRDASDIRFRLGGFEGRPVSSSEIIALYSELNDTDAPADATWIYNNAAYMLVSSAVERVADMPFEDFVWKRICAPLGMYETIVKRWDTAFSPNTATPHTLAANGNFERRFWGLEFAGAGSMSSCVDDMLRWLRHMDSPLVGNNRTWSLMLTPQVLSNGTSTGYGFGLMRDHYRGAPIICHGGGWIGGNAQALKVPSVGLDVVVISNRSDAFAPVLVNQILDALIPDLDPPPESAYGPPRSEGFSLYRLSADGPHCVSRSTAPNPKPPRDGFLCGDFISPGTDRVIQLFGRDGRQIVSIDGHDLPYDRLGESTLAPIAIWSHVKRFVDLVGDPHFPNALRLTDFGAGDELVRIVGDQAPESSRFIGRYRANIASGTATIVPTDSGLRLITGCIFGSGEYVISALSDRVCRISCASSAFLDAILVFARDYSAFYLSSYNVRRLPFLRV